MSIKIGWVRRWVMNDAWNHDFDNGIAIDKIKVCIVRGNMEEAITEMKAKEEKSREGC